MTTDLGLLIKKEDFKSLKEEIQNIKENINEEIFRAGVFMNENEEYICRPYLKKIYEKSSPEKKYDLNEIIKYYELNKNNKYIYGYTSDYFRKLTDLMAKKKHKTYSKERLDLFNSRVNNSKKLYNNYLKRKGKELGIKSIINKEIKANLIYKSFMNNKNSFSSNNISTFSKNEYDKKLLKIKLKK